MKTTITNIVDSNSIDNSQATKILLFNNLLEHFAPMFYEETRKKHGQFSNSRAEVKKLRSTISEYHNQLLKLKEEILAESLKNRIMVEIETLITNGNVPERIKIEFGKIISAFDKQPNVELEKRLTQLQRMTAKIEKKG